MLAETIESWTLPSLRALAIASAIALAAAGCGDSEGAGALGAEERSGGAETTGVTDDEIVLGTYGALSGPLANPQVTETLEAAVERVNADGGINGRTVRLISYDVQRDTNKAVVAARRLVERDKVFAILGPIGQEPANVSVAPYLEQQNIPAVGVLTTNDVDPALGPRRWMLNLSAEAAAPGLATFVTEELDGERVALVYSGGGPAYEAYAKAYRDALVDAGVEVVAYEAADPTDTDAYLGSDASALAGLRDTDPDVLIGLRCCYVWPKTMRAQKWTDVPVVFPTANEFGGWDAQVLELCGPACDGVAYTDTQGFLPATASTPQMEEMRAAVSEYADGAPEVMAFNQVVPWAHAQLLFEAIRAQGDDVTRSGVAEWLNARQDHETGLAPPFSFSQSDHMGLRSTTFLKAEDGGFVPVGE